MDPISGALLAFTAIKKGIAIGKDLSSMGKDLNNLFSFIDGAKAAHKNPSNKSDPLSSYIAYEKAMDYEKQLRDIIIDARGMKGYAKFEQFRREAKKAEREGKYQAIRRKNKMINVMGILIAFVLTGVGAYGMIWFAMQYK
jgi:hypothetical protein